MSGRTSTRPRGTPRRTAAVVSALAAIALAAAVAGCAGNADRPVRSGDQGPAATFPLSSIGPNRTVSPAIEPTRAELVRVLGTRNLVLTDTQAPFRPPESPVMAVVPRAVFQVVLPADPGQGFIVVYEFADPGAATEGASAQAAYLATGPARVQSSLGSRHVIRLLGSTVVTYSWDPEGARDPAAPDIQAALETLGSAVDVPS